MHPILSILPGIIWAGFIGLAIGNFATNPIFRLPRNESLFTKDPFCDSCNAKLRPRDLFPVFSWLLSRGRCRYCGAKVPGAYTFTEALIGLLFIICYLKFGFSEQFLLVSFGMTAFVMLAMMLSLDNFFSNKTLMAALVFGMLYRTLQEGTLYGFAGGGFAGLMVGAAVWKLSCKNLVRDVASFPAYLKLLVAAGVWLPFFQLCTVFIVALLALPLRKNRQWLLEWSIITSIILLTLTRSLL